MSPDRRAFLRGVCAAALAPALPDLTVPVRASAALDTARRAAEFEAASNAYRAYQRALLRQLCDALAIDYDTFTRDAEAATAAQLRLKLAAAYPRSPIASAGARQGLPTAIPSTGAAS